MKPPIFYYRVRGVIPRPLQIGIRRAVAKVRRRQRDISWPIDGSAGGVPEGFRGWPDGRRFALVLRHDVESAHGVSDAIRLAALERAREFRSAFFFVPEEYGDSSSVRSALARDGFEIGVHGLTHDGMLYASHREFSRCAGPINEYLGKWKAAGFASPSSHHEFAWLHELNIEYDTSSFDTDPFEPQPDGVRTIFPITQWDAGRTHSYVELPYTLPQDFTLFVILQETSIATWTRKLDWIAERGGLALVNSHPDYMRFRGGARRPYTYDAGLYEEFLDYVLKRYGSSCWHALPIDVARYWRTATAGPDEPAAPSGTAGRE